LEQLQGSAKINEAKVVLADEATALLHGPECLASIHETISNMFQGAGTGSTESLPRVNVEKSALDEGGIRLLDLFVDLGLSASKKEARRLIQGGGAKIDTVPIQEENASLTIADFQGKNEVILRAGKKRAGVVEYK
jgi:tyrosyl-tRNA synthetase